MKEYIFVKTNKGIVKLFVADILFIKSNGDYVNVHTKLTKYILLITMNKILSILGDDFFRINNQTIIQLREIDKIIDNTIYMTNSEYFPISRSKVVELKSKLVII